MQELRKKKIEGMLIGSSARWIGDGEKVSKYFCNLEKRHYTSKIIRKIEKQDGTIVTEQDDIVKETKYFCEHTQEEQINYVNFEEIIQEQESIPKLTEEQCNSLEGKISKDEVLSTLKRMKNGTSPGSDGFTVEFLKVYLERYLHSTGACNKRKFQKRKPILPAKGRTNYIATKGGQKRQFLENWDQSRY